MMKFKPRVLCFNGKNAAKQFFGRSKVDYGLQTERIGQTLIFVAPSTSGAAGRWWDITFWQELTKLCKSNER